MAVGGARKRIQTNAPSTVIGGGGTAPNVSFEATSQDPVIVATAGSVDLFGVAAEVAVAALPTIDLFTLIEDGPQVALVPSVDVGAILQADVALAASIDAWVLALEQGVFLSPDVPTLALAMVELGVTSTVDIAAIQLDTTVSLATAASVDTFTMSLTGPGVAAAISVVNVEAYTVAGSYTWTAPPGVIAVRLDLFGSGGGGGTSTGTGGGGGGGGGGYARRTAQAVTPGTGYPLVVAAGGAVATNGADTTFNTTTCVAKGGVKGSTNSGTTQGAGGTGGTGSTGDATFNGGTGGGSASLQLNGGGGGGCAGNAANGGTGGNPTGGTGGNALGGSGGGGASAGTPASAGNAPGGGGGGASSLAAGAAGAVGRAYLTYVLI